VTARTLVQPLFDGPVDIVGDVHGCLEELRILMGHLGYDASGTHPEGRRLVFLGDLTDRGPDNEGVVRLVKGLVEGGWAQCILGNHEFNLLLRSRKPENGWFFGEPREGEKAADEAVRAMVLEFFATLPLALERPDLRVIHACWEEKMLALARQATCALTLHDEQRQAIERSFEGRSLDRIDQGLERQNKNPVKLLISGPEARVAVPFVAGGKERWEDRVRWWEDYQPETHCIFGHYALKRSQHRSTRRAVCIDFGLCYRGEDRALAAARFPEKQLIFHDGQRQAL
jgi:hypothetical protein